MAKGINGVLAGSVRVAAHYLARRFGNPFINGVCIAALRNGAEGAVSAITTSRFEVRDFGAGLFGRYANGGATQFAESMHAEGISDEQLSSLARNLGRSAAALFFSAGGFLALGSFQIAAASQERQLLLGIATVFTAFIFLVLSARHDFCRWKIKSRRFGCFQEYLREYYATSPKPSVSAKK